MPTVLVLLMTVLECNGYPAVPTPGVFATGFPNPMPIRLDWGKFTSQSPSPLSCDWLPLIWACLSHVTGSSREGEIRNTRIGMKGLGRF